MESENWRTLRSACLPTVKFGPYDKDHGLKKTTNYFSSSLYCVGTRSYIICKYDVALELKPDEHVNVPENAPIAIIIAVLVVALIVGLSVIFILLYRRRKQRYGGVNSSGGDTDTRESENMVGGTDEELELVDGHITLTQRNENTTGQTNLAQRNETNAAQTPLTQRVETNAAQTALTHNHAAQAALTPQRIEITTAQAALTKSKETTTAQTALTQESKQPENDTETN